MESSSHSSTETEPLIKGDPGRRYVPKKYYTGDLKTIRETDEDRSPTSPLGHTWSFSSGSWRTSWLGRHQGLTEALAIGGLIAISTLCFVSGTISLPIYLGEMESVGGGMYTALVLSLLPVPLTYFVIMLLVKLVLRGRFCVHPTTPTIYLSGNGLLLSLGIILLCYSAPPWRTLSFMHPVLQTIVLPVSCVATMLRGTNRMDRLFLVAMIVQAIGVVLSLFPMMFSFARGVDFPVVPWTYSMLHAFAWCLLAISFVTFTFLIHRFKDNPFVFLSWLHLVILLWAGLLFWTNVLPGLGMADDFSEFAELFWTGIQCYFTSCNKHLVVEGAVFSCSFAIGTFSILLLVSFRQGATYLATVLLLSTLFSTIFWTLFRAWPHFEFHATYDKSSVYIVVGLAVTIIGLLLFIYVNVVVSPPKIPERSPRVRTTSMPVRITRRELFPTLRRQRSTTYTVGDPLHPTSLSAPPPGLRISAAAHASCTRGFVMRGSRPIRTPSRRPRRDSIPRASSSPALLSL